ncbi:hypothetical protein OESDEN_03795 [Oesophagostomum dentatum]|uniref:Uncharacterized protein n=1 Tax=Oesophagostomum dentatum TaxID=61180 RepID=A0A0B1TFD1_OESDE|nr:hypothetical protein OESDEN_03795 [Oesophagostomum dentatum]
MPIYVMDNEIALMEKTNHQCIVTSTNYIEQNWTRSGKKRTE